MSDPSRSGVQPAAEPSVRLPVAVLVLVATVLAALLAVSAVIRLDSDRLPSGPPREPPAAPASVPPTTFTVDPERRARFEEFRVTLAGPPYSCREPAAAVTPGFAALVVCSHTVHPDFDGAGSSWAATTGVILLDDTLVTEGDLERTTQTLFEAVLSYSYSREDRPVPTKMSQTPATVPAPAGRAYTRVADVTVTRRGLPTPYDRLVVVVVQLTSGRHVAFFSSFPHDADQPALSALVASVDSMSAR